MLDTREGTITEQIRVIVADDHPAFREGLVRLLAEEKDIEILAQANDGEEAVELARQLSPDVVIMDIAMPKRNGIEATRAIKEISPNTAILIFSAYDYDAYVLGAIQAGASGYLLKNVRVLELVNAIRSLHAGEMVLAPNAAHKVLRRIPHTQTQKREGDPQGLNQRELEVLKLAARGMNNHGIAGELSISVRTVQSHLVNIFAKLEVNSRTEAVVRALKEGWIALENVT